MEITEFIIFLAVFFLIVIFAVLHFTFHQGKKAAVKQLKAAQSFNLIEDAYLNQPPLFLRVHDLINDTELEDADL